MPPAGRAKGKDEKGFIQTKPSKVKTRQRQGNDKARHSKARHDKARHGKARQGTQKQDKTQPWQGKARIYILLTNQQ